MSNNINTKENKKGAREKTALNVRMCKDEYLLIKDAAEEQNMSLSEYVRERITNGVDGIRLKNKQAILSPLVTLSNYINDLEESEAKTEMQRATMRIWNLLKDQFIVEEE